MMGIILMGSNVFKIPNKMLIKNAPIRMVPMQTIRRHIYIYTTQIHAHKCAYQTLITEGSVTLVRQLQYPKKCSSI